MPTNFKALHVGIKYLGQKIELHNSVRDLQRLRECIASLGFQGEERILADDPGIDRFGDPSKTNIEEQILWLTGSAKPGDCLFFSYRGRAKDNSLLPVDHHATGELHEDALFDLLVNTLQVGVRLTMLMDCGSTNLITLPYAWSGKSDNMHENASYFKCLSSGKLRKRPSVITGEVVIISAGPIKGSSENDSGGYCIDAFHKAFQDYHQFTHSYWSLGHQMQKLLECSNATVQLLSSRSLDLHTMFSFHQPLVVEMKRRNAGYQGTWTCTKQHTLTKMVSLPPYYISWGCDVCKNEIPHSNDGTLHCAECRYDVCPSCQIIKCPLGHCLVAVSGIPSYYKWWLCNVCKKSIPIESTRTLHCGECEFDVCPDCQPDHLPHLAKCDEWGCHFEEDEAWE